MDKDEDIKLYNKYLNGEKEAFNILYSKYKNKIHYFVFNIVKDYQKAEDITQEVFIYVLNNKFKDGYSFKYYIYLIARSRAITYINVENRRKDIMEQYLLNVENELQEDILDNIIKEENKKELVDAINQLDDKYKNAIYLVKIEGLSYIETAQILGQTVENIKNLIHRAKNMLFKILIKKGFNEMNKVYKILIITLCIGIILTGVVYATIKVSDTIKEKAKITPIYTSNISTIDTNKVWCGTFNLIWNDFMDQVVGGNIEFEDGYSDLANELNKQNFTIQDLEANSYFKIHGIKNIELKNKIEEGIKEKFNETSDIVDKCEWESTQQRYILYAMLKKEFNYLEKFPILESGTFGDSQDKVKFFGLMPSNVQDASRNITVLFYNSKEDFAIRLKTKEGEEVFLYKTTGENRTFEENYNEMLKKHSNYLGSITWDEKDMLKIPFIKVKDEINYDELCGRYIKGTNIYIEQALQTIRFELNNYGGSVKSEALIEATRQATFYKGREFVFDDTFLLYLKEYDKEKPYFALRVDNIDVLVNVNE